ncbi:TlpA family protein disulfide reductase [Sphingobacterium lactis]|uniref:TlpA family protein disulfide reductase n=1 Tax=Sphingobacterium lactis TaxID=797291 RepID=UPI003DA5531A
MKLFYSYMWRQFAHIPTLSRVFRIPLKIFSPAKIGHRLVYVRQVLFALPFCFIMFCYAQAQSPERSGTVSGSKIKPLKIGDQIPEELWNTPLQVVNHPEGKETITLSEYKDKLIILDFWATWCTTCLIKLPLLHNSVSKYQNEIQLVPITYEKGVNIENYFTITRNGRLKELWKHFMTVVNEKKLTEFFPHQSLPFVVVIKNGKVLGFPASSIVDETFLRESINGASAPKDPTLLNKKNRTSFYSLLSGFKEKETDASIKSDTISKSTLLEYINHPISRLYQLTGMFSEVFSTSSTVVADFPIGIDLSYTEDSKESQNPNYLEWYRKNLFSYELNAPIGYDERVLKEKMRNDLDFYLGVSSTIEEREIPVYVVKFTGNVEKIVSRSKGGSIVMDGTVYDRSLQNRKKAPLSPTGNINYILGGKLQDIIRILQRISPNRPVIDETNITTLIDVDFADDTESFSDMAKTLGQQGFEIKEQFRPMKVLVLSNQPPIINPFINPKQ